MVINRLMIETIMKISSLFDILSLHEKIMVMPIQWRLAHCAKPHPIQYKTGFVDYHFKMGRPLHTPQNSS